MSFPKNDHRPLARRLNEQAVLDGLFREGPVSRVELASITGMSKPTVSSIVEDLVRAGLVHASGRSSGRVGRTAALYEVNPAVGHIVGVDLGGTKVRAALCDLFGTILAETVSATNSTSSDELVGQILAMAEELVDAAGIAESSVLALAVGAPGVIDLATGVIKVAYNIPILVGVDLASRLAEGRAWHVTVDTDVRMAAVGERWQGLAKRCDSFAFLAIGTGIGMGLLLNGEIWQGYRGGAGEVGHLPMGHDPLDAALPEAGSFEESASGRGIVARYRRAVDSNAGQVAAGELTAQAVFAAADAGDEYAIAVVDEEARLLASAIASVNAVIAPELVVLGGGIGSSPQLLEPVRRYVKALRPDATLRVETSALGHRAPLFGALAIGLQSARAEVRRAPAQARVGREIG